MRTTQQLAFAEGIASRPEGTPGADDLAEQIGGGGGQVFWVVYRQWDGGPDRVALEGRSGERRAAGSALTLSDGSGIGEPSREAVRIDRPSVLVSIREQARTESVPV